MGHYHLPGKTGLGTTAEKTWIALSPIGERLQRVGMGGRETQDLLVGLDGGGGAGYVGEAVARQEAFGVGDDALGALRVKVGEDRGLVAEGWAPL